MIVNQQTTMAVFLFVIYFLLSIGMNFIPTLLTTFRDLFSLRGEEVARMQMSKDIGLVIFSILGIFLIKKASFRMAIIMSLFLGIGGSVLFMFSMNFWFILAAAALHGGAFGLGSVVIVTHLFRLPTSFHRLSLLYSNFGMAGFVAPWIAVSLLSEESGVHFIYLFFSTLLLLAIVSSFSVRNHVCVSGDSFTQIDIDFFLKILPATGIYTLIMISETIFIIWLMNLLQLDRDFTFEQASITLSAFWLAFMIGRAVGDEYGRILGYELALGVLAMLATFACMAVIVGDCLLAWLGIGIFALSIAPINPLFQSLTLSKVSHEQHNIVNGIFFSFSAMGTIVFIQISGYLAEYSPILPFVLSALLLILLSLMFFYIFVRFLYPKDVNAGLVTRK